MKKLSLVFAVAAIAATDNIVWDTYIQPVIDAIWRVFAA